MRIKTYMFLLAAFGTISSFVTQAGATPNNTKIYLEVKKAVIQQLKDPDSARFGTLTRETRPNLRGEPMDVVCGEVNARNSFGGYTGMSGFVYFINDKTIYFADGSGPMGDLGATVYDRFCGTPIPSDSNLQNSPPQ